MNAYLQLDPESKKRMQKLKGKVISIELLPMHFNFQCQFSEHHVSIHMDDLLKPDTTIRGTPLQMVGVMINQDNRHVFFAEDLVITGNVLLGQEMIGLFDELHIDWEEYLSHKIGDVPSYHLGKFFKGIKKWMKNTDKSFSHNIDEYLHEELNCLPTDEELQDFFADIDSLRMDADRLEAQLAHLKALLTKGENET